MAKPYTGSDATLLLGAEELAKVKQYSFSASAGLLETTSLGDNSRTFTYGLRTYTGSATLIYYKQDDNSNDASTLLKSIINTNTSGLSSTDKKALTMRFKDGTDLNDVAMNVYITGANFSASAGEILQAQISFQATGDLTSVSI
tara:strand:- start:2997 stop:3428 length:432 start_codon:yes stop_codon:yes gene_type:complete